LSRLFPSETLFLFFDFATVEFSFAALCSNFLFFTASPFPAPGDSCFGDYGVPLFVNAASNSSVINLLCSAPTFSLEMVLVLEASKAVRVPVPSKPYVSSKR
jgi:hypothetical protein